MSTSLWTAEEAARALGGAARTLRDRAARAHAARDPGVLRVGGRWAASEAWWRGCLSLPAPHGRQPRRMSNPVE